MKSKITGSTSRPIEVPRKPLIQAAGDLNDRSENFWKLQCAELTKEKDVLKSQVENLKKMVKEQSSLRQGQIEMLATNQLEIAKYQDEVKNLKAELNKTKLEISQLRRSNRNSTNSNNRHPNMNKVFRKKRLLEEENQNLSSQLTKMSDENFALSMKMNKNMGIMLNILGQ